MAEVATDGLVDQRGAVGEKQDALFQAALPQAIDDLEGGVGLARAGRHDEQVTIASLVLGDGFNRAVDRGLLVVAGHSVRPIQEIILRDDRLDLVGDPFVGPVFLPKLFGSRERIEGEFGLDRPVRDRSVVEVKGITVAAENKRDVQGLAITQRLLDSRADRMVVVLGLDNGDRDVGLVVENVVGSLLLAARVNLATHIDSPVREANLLANLRVDVPPRRDNARRDELRTDVALAQAFLVHDFCSCSCS